MCSLRHCQYNLCPSLCSSGKPHISVRILHKAVTSSTRKNVYSKLNNVWRLVNFDVHNSHIVVSDIRLNLFRWVWPFCWVEIEGEGERGKCYRHYLPSLKCLGWRPAWEDPGPQYLQPGRVRAGPSWIKLSSAQPRCFQTSPGGTAGDSGSSSEGSRRSGSYWLPLWGSNNDENMFGLGSAVWVKMRSEIITLH